METYIAALDQGTTTSRAILFNSRGEIVSKAQYPFRQIFPQPGWVEHDPMEIWATTVRALSEAVDAAHIDPTVPQLADIKTAVSEAVTNCIVHAYPDHIGPVAMSIAVYPGREVHITVADKGIGIPDIPQAMEPLFTTGNPEERSGLGFAVMQSFMDKVKVISKPGKGTKVLLIKRLTQRE